MISIKEKRERWLRRFEEERELLRGRVAEDIETHRKGEVRIRLTDALGAPLSNARVRITQKTHDFGFGAHIFMLDGFETLDEIAGVRTNFNDRPLREQKMKSVTIEE